MFANIQEVPMNKELERLNDEKTRNEAKMRQLKNEIKAMEAAEKGFSGSSGTGESSLAAGCWKHSF